MKKFSLCFLLLIFSMTFVGCSSAKPLSSINTCFSSIFYAIDCSENGLSDMTEEEQNIVKNKIQTLAADYIEEVKLRYFSVLDSLVLSNKITSSERVLYRNHLTPYVGWNGNSYVIEFRFYTTLASRIFITSCTYSGTINQQYAFSMVTTEKFEDIFSKTQNGIIKTSLEEYFKDGIKASLSALGENSFDKYKDPNFYYFFVTQNSRLHAVGHDEELSISGGKIFCFYAPEDSEELVFEFYVVQANQFAYYLIAIAITSIFIAIYMVIIFIKNNRKLKQKDEKKFDEIKIEIEE